MYLLKPKEIVEVEKAVKQDKCMAASKCDSLVTLGTQARKRGRATNGECSNDL